MTPQHQERFVAFWSSAQPAVSNYVHALLRDHATAKDVVQETAIVLFRRFPEYDESRPFLSWALGIARYQVLSVNRDAQRSPVAFDEEILAQFTEQWAEVAQESSDRAHALESCIERLTARSMRLLRLRYFEDWDADAISRKMGGTSGSVRVALKRVRDQLRECVKNQLLPSGGPP